jgi:hypothetical protein
VGAGIDNKVGCDQFALAGVVTVRVGRVTIAAPATPAAGYVGNEGPFGASPDVGPGVAEGTVSVATGDIAVMGVGHVISSPLPMLHGQRPFPIDYD